MRCADCSRVYGHQLLLLFVRASLRGHREEGGAKRAGRGAQEGCTYSQRTQLEAQHARRRGAPLAHVVLDLRARRRRRASVSSMKWDAHVAGSSGTRVASGQEHASRGSSMELTCEREGSGCVRLRASAGGERRRIAWRQRCGKRVANSRRHGDPCVQLKAADEVGQAREEWDCLDMPGSGGVDRRKHTVGAR